MLVLPSVVRLRVLATSMQSPIVKLAVLRGELEAGRYLFYMLLNWSQRDFSSRTQSSGTFSLMEADSVTQGQEWIDYYDYSDGYDYSEGPQISKF